MIIARQDTYRYWTDGAINYYERQMKCAGCIDEYICKKQRKEVLTGLTPMKYAVLMLFALHGAPKRRVYGDKIHTKRDGHTQNALS